MHSTLESSGESSLRLENPTKESKFGLVRYLVAELMAVVERRRRRRTNCCAAAAAAARGEWEME